MIESVRLKSICTTPSPRDPTFTRINARIAVENHGAELAYWYELPADLAGDVSSNGNPWAVLLLPLAAHFREPIRLDLPVDPFLAANLRGVSQIWTSWGCTAGPVAVEAPPLAPSDAPTGVRTISSFSGGVDSLFTFLRHKDAPLGDAACVIDDFLLVGGFNTSIDDFDLARAEIGAAAAKFDRRLVALLTNMRYGDHAIETPYAKGRSMEAFAHGCFLAGMVHLLDRRYRTYVIPATHCYTNLMPWGSHPLTDRLLSSRNLAVVNDGNSFHRVDRTRPIAQSDEALAVLHVCWQDRREGNCSRCEKCLRTMATLDLLGARDRAATFDWSGYSMESLARADLRNENTLTYFHDIATAADEAGRPDVALAARTALARSTRKLRLKRLVNANPVTRAAWSAARAVVRRPARS